MTDWGQINITARPGLLVQAGSSPALLNNTDANHTVWLSDDQFALDGGDLTNASPLSPLGSVVFDGKASVWGVCPSGQTALVSRYPGGLNFFQLVEILLKTLLITGAAGNGAFVYSGTPGAGDLAESIAAFDGSDQFLNHVFNGFTAYSGNGNTDLFMALRKAGLVWGTNQNGPGGTGALAIVDAVTLRIQNALLATDPNNAGNAEPFHKPTPAGTWANIAGEELEYRLNSDKTVTLVGQLTIPSGIGTGSATIATVLPAYVPARSQPIVMLEQGASPTFTITPHAGLVRAVSGNIDVFGACTAANALNVIGRYPLDS